MSTIQDVARLAGVSVSTVSNVLNGREARMRPETLALVKNAIAELAFRPNQSARMLKTGHMQMIVLMVPSIANPFFGVMARWVEAAALEQGYGLLLCNTYRDAQRERDYAESFMAQGVRGVILGSALQAHEHLVPLVDRGLAIVSLDRVSSTDGLLRDFVSVDNHMAAVLAAEHLIACGHKHITFVGAPATSVNRIARVEGARDACARASVPLEVFVGAPQANYNENEMIDLGRFCAETLIRTNCRSTAFIGVNDMLAIGLLAGMRQNGRVVPNDVSVVGIDGLFLGEYVSPPLTTVRQPLREIAEAAVGFVLSRIKDPRIAARERIFAPELVARESAGPPPTALSST